MVDGGNLVVFRVRHGQGFLPHIGPVGRRPTRKRFRAHLFVGPFILTPEVRGGAPPEKTKAAQIARGAAHCAGLAKSASGKRPAEPDKSNETKFVVGMYCGAAYHDWAFAGVDGCEVVRLYDVESDMCRLAKLFFTRRHGRGDVVRQLDCEAARPRAQSGATWLAATLCFTLGFLTPAVIFLQPPGP
jgi:hypothetical protein